MMPTFQHDLLSLKGGGPVSGLYNELGVELVGIGLVDGLLKGSGNENITG
jgi:hypothetical protein